MILALVLAIPDSNSTLSYSETDESFTLQLKMTTNFGKYVADDEVIVTLSLSTQNSAIYNDLVTRVTLYSDDVTENTLQKTVIFSAENGPNGAFQKAYSMYESGVYQVFGFLARPTAPAVVTDFLTVIEVQDGIQESATVDYNLKKMKINVRITTTNAQPNGECDYHLALKTPYLNNNGEKKQLTLERKLSQAKIGSGYVLLGMGDLNVVYYENGQLQKHPVTQEVANVFLKSFVQAPQVLVNCYEVEGNIRIRRSTYYTPSRIWEL